MGAHVIARRIDGVAPGNGLQHLGRAMAKAVIEDLDEGSVMGLYGVAGVQLGQPIGKDGLPIGPQIKYMPAQFRPRHRAADDGDDPAMARASAAHFADRVQCDGKVADMLEAGCKMRQDDTIGLRNGLLT